MPIVIHLDRLLSERGLTLTELSNRIGLTVANLSILKTGKARAIRFSTLEAICRELGCQPAELLEWVPTGPGAERWMPRERRPGPDALPGGALERGAA